MRKVLFLLCLFVFMGSVNAITLDKMVTTINEGLVTKEFVERKLAVREKDKKKWSQVIINAAPISNGISIAYSYFGDNPVSGQLYAYIQEDGKTLRSVIKYNEKDDYIPTEEIELHDLLVFWALEASDSFPTIQKYNIKNSDYISLFEPYFSKCYRKEMHACRTYVKTYDDYEYISDVELTEDASEYVIVKLKEAKREADNEEMMRKLFILGVILAIIFVIAKCFEKKPQVLKY